MTCMIGNLGKENMKKVEKIKFIVPPTEDEVFERNRGNAKTIFEGIDLFEYLTDKNVTSPLAKSFREQKFEGEDSRVFQKLKKIFNQLKVDMDDTEKLQLEQETFWSSLS